MGMNDQIRRTAHSNMDAQRGNTFIPNLDILKLGILKSLKCKRLNEMTREFEYVFRSNKMIP